MDGGITQDPSPPAFSWREREKGTMILASMPLVAED
jgi:hypothetical protein